MFDDIYLETDEEVTSAIDKIKKSKKKKVAISLPRNAVLGQSIVNLKLLYKEAVALGKVVALVSPDKVTRGLADRVGYPVFETMKSVDFKGIAEPEGPDDDAANNEAEAAPTLTRQRFDGAKAEPEKNEEDEISEEETTDAGKDEPEESVDNDPDEKEHDDSPPLHADHKESSAKASGGMIPTRGNLRFFRQQKRKAVLKPLLIVGIALILAGVSALVAIPTAQVNLTVAAQPFQDTVRSTVDSSATTLDKDRAILPGKSVTATQETRSSAKASGKKDIGTKATGTVTLTNAWDSSEKAFAAGTTLRAKNGNEYVLASAVTIPGATSTVSGGQSVITPGTKDAKVEASAPGDAYNIAPTTFTIPSLSKSQQEKIYGTSVSAFTGGASSVVTVVTEGDITKLTDAVKAQNKTEGLAALKAQTADSVVLEAAIQTVSQDIVSATAADTQAESLEVVVKGTYRVITYTAADYDLLVRGALTNKIPQGHVLVTEGEGVKLDTSKVELNLVSDTKLELTTNIQAFTIADFSQTALARSLVGANPKSLESIASKYVPIKASEVMVAPRWFPRLPYWSSHIKIKYNYVATPL